MNDMTAVIEPKSDQINADDLIAGPRTIVIAGVRVAPGQEQPVSVAIEGDRKVYRPCKGMARVMVQFWGADSGKYVGRAMTLYHDPDVTWAGVKVGGIRISHMSDIPEERIVAVAVNRKTRKPLRIMPLRTGQRRAPNSAPAEEAAASPATIDAGAALSPASGGGMFEDPGHVVLAHSLDLQYRSAATMADLETAWRDTAQHRKAVIAADGTYKDVFAKILDREKDRLSMADMGHTSDGKAA